MTQGVSVMSDVAVSVCVLRAKLRGQQLAVCHQSGGPSTPPAQMFQVVDGLIKQNTGIKTRTTYSNHSFFRKSARLVFSLRNFFPVRVD